MSCTVAPAPFWIRLPTTCSPDMLPPTTGTDVLVGVGLPTRIGVLVLVGVRVGVLVRVGVRVGVVVLVGVRVGVLRASTPVGAAVAGVSELTSRKRPMAKAITAAREVNCMARSPGRHEIATHHPHWPDSHSSANRLPAR